MELSLSDLQGPWTSISNPKLVRDLHVWGKKNGWEMASDASGLGVTCAVVPCLWVRRVEEPSILLPLT